MSADRSQVRVDADVAKMFRARCIQDDLNVGDVLTALMRGFLADEIAYRPATAKAVTPGHTPSSEVESYA